MSVKHNLNLISSENTSSILQLNCQRSPGIVQSLFNDPNSSLFLAILLQEPPMQPKDVDQECADTLTQNSTQC
ncbi:hypothetical protein CROQUDRAFT_102553 [Cronartium quercuum f. sp. fusiforme G11]|uniref:Uncharacterized protein n=1 Tax=Cronartium quercuum f. sp. fusiforme G11 TaxID=708437 RepID=A0A9P6N784_9BASI|nr:hypothetical protein CROQUDRAFT_102553 [Cronartium quercuum f. sp. fusiforme G11]